MNRRAFFGLALLPFAATVVPVSAPDEILISRVCKAFKCLPVAAAVTVAEYRVTLNTRVLARQVVEHLPSILRGQGVL